MKYKKRVFIGSSKEGLALAQKAKAILSSEFDVVVWNEDVFKLGQNFLTDLHKATLLFDYALLIGTLDDKVSFRGTDILAARDNITFELGLFLGKLGANRCAYAIDKAIHIPTDLTGISHATFETHDATSFDDAINSVLKFFKQNSYAEVGYLPSVILAASYYGNFLAPLHSYFHEHGIVINGVKYKKCTIRILVPNEIHDDVNLQGKKWVDKFGAKSFTIEIKGRPRGYSILANEADGSIEIIDFPTTLAGINNAIGYLLPGDMFKNTDDYNLVLHRELESFFSALQILIKKGGMEDMVIFES